jgi:hypothetical protein
MKNNIRKTIIPLFLILFYSCGESVVEIGEQTYAPKIVIEGFLSPGQKIQNIKITRNFPLNSRPDAKSLFLTNAVVKLLDLQNNRDYTLTYNPQKFSYEYRGSDLTIDYGESYKLFVTAEVNGNTLNASSITKVPNRGFRIIQEESLLDSMKYYERNPNGSVKKFKIVFEPSPGNSFYGISIVALDATLESFVFDNPFIQIKVDDLKKDFDRYKYQSKWLQNVKTDVNRLNYNIDWLDTWFYGNYRLIIYAGDENYRLFMLTYRGVQEFDGNFHEPRLNIEGDGIGIFASVIADTAYFKVLK